MFEDDGLVRVQCRTCTEPCIRNPQSGKWFHEDDYLDLSSPFVQKYDHPAAPDIIEVPTLKELDARQTP